MTDFMESLAHVKNEKTMMQVSEVPEFTKLAAFINEYTSIGDLAKAKDYTAYLFSEYNLLSLLSHSKKQIEQIESSPVRSPKRQSAG